ncbi:hypothetical protein V1478_004507 [Vespula squamosa]|uniref:Uncharacterized protein n=1 Tax=Vespula squamosa TaxID=30214 RepID=A0ABD2BGR4_VESSQ
MVQSYDSLGSRPHVRPVVARANDNESSADVKIEDRDSTDPLRSLNTGERRLRTSVSRKEWAIETKLEGAT